MAKSLEFLELDFNDPKEVFIALNFSSVDFRDIGANKGSHSKKLVMPSTKVNDSFFGMSFDVTSEGFFDPLIKVPIQISEIEFYGTLQLNSVKVINGKPISYSVNLFGDLADWASLIGETGIRDLTHHKSHILDLDTVVNSWNSSGLDSDYVYPMISYGNFLQDRESDFSIDVAFWRPAFFVLPLIRQIFKEVGYTLIDTGIVNTEFKNAILPFTSKEVDLPDLEVIASRDLGGAQSTNFGFATGSDEEAQIIKQFNNGNSPTLQVIPVSFEDEPQDTGDLFVNESGIYIAPSTDSYNFSISMEVFVNMITLDIGLDNDRTLAVVGAVLSDGVNSVPISQTESFTRLESPGTAFLTGNVDITLTKDTPYFIGIQILRSPKTTGDILVNTAGINIKPLASTLVSGALMEHGKVIQNIKKIDLIKAIVRKGNFRILTDNQKKTVEFVQERDFLLTKPENWDDKVDHSKPVDISFIQNQGAKELTWSYDNDSSDGFILDKEGRNDVDWGKRQVQLDSEYRKGSRNVYTSIFSSTIDGTGQGIKMPVMSTQEFKQDEAITRGTFETNFENRILIYDGLRSGNFSIQNTAKTEYPFSYFVGKDFSLQWNNLSDFYSGALDQGLVDRYYQNAIKRLNKSRLYSGWFFLSELDISSLDFRTPKIINGVHYYLNNVIDYKVNANQPTEVELISR